MEFSHEVSECILLGWLAAIIGSKDPNCAFVSTGVIVASIQNMATCSLQGSTSYVLSIHYDRLNGFIRIDLSCDVGLCFEGGVNIFNVHRP